MGPPVVKEPREAGNVSRGIEEPAEDFLSKLDSRGGGEVVTGKESLGKVVTKRASGNGGKNKFARNEKQEVNMKRKMDREETEGA